jgi:DNA repair protein RecN (Recombination protein N)
MIRLLSIRNLAIVEAADLEFAPGFNVLTGETGAGKSILVEAVGLLVGGRASADLVRTGAESAQIQALFESADGLETIVRRDISAQGRSRIFVDDALTTAAALKERGGVLVELHGQHEHQVLLDPASHLDLVDEAGQLSAERQTVATRFEVWRSLRDELDRSQMDERERAARIDLLTFQAKEIAQVAPRAGEDEALAAERIVLANADKLQRLCDECYGDLYERDGAILSTLASVWKRVGELASLDPRFAPYLDARDSVKTQLEDLSLFLRNYGAGLESSPERLQQVEDRLARIERLKRKYGPALSDVLEKKATIDRELEQIGTASERAGEIEARLREARQQFLRDAGVLSRRRREAAAVLARGVEELCRGLAMEHTRCEVRFGDPQPESLWSAAGVDRAEFHLSPNPGEELRPLARIASGGELSRLMLALRTLTAVDVPGKTLIFDEVDAGIGGRVADAVGERLRKLGERFQVLCITHLPQIASYAGTHFRIEKTVERGRTVTRVDRLDQDGRVKELARMIGGAAVSPQVEASAREMLLRRSPAAHPPGTAARTTRRK